MDINLLLNKEKRMSPKAYASFVAKQENRNNVTAVRFIPPTIGQKGFGSFVVNSNSALSVLPLTKRAFPSLIIS
ncbi:MAG: hypothetical protein SPL30_04120 [Succinivibrio sp.]|jgi:hypothetical protein|nr:hypothetical protein [Succinivibrio sp.]